MKEKNTNKIFVDDFVVVDPPIPMDDTFIFIKSTEYGDLYEWGKLGILSGKKGMAYIKNGQVIAYKITHIS